jgi:hypothetical protein
MRVPSEPKKGDSIRQKICEMLRYMRATTVTGVVGGRLVGSGNGQTIQIPRAVTATQADNAVIPPLHVELISKTVGEVTTFFVTVSPGVVTDRVPVTTGSTGDDAEISYEPGNLYYSAEEANPAADPPIVEGAPKRFEIDFSEKVCVRVEVLATGAIGHETKPPEEWVEIVVLAEGYEGGTHYVPPVADDDEGVPGTYIYELAELLMQGEGEEATPYLRPIMMGSNIDHYRERPMMDNTGAGANVLKDYDAETDNYRFRSVNGRFGIDHEQSDDQIELDAAIANQGTGAAVWIEYVGFADDPPATPPDEPIKLRTIRGLSSSEGTTEGIDPQIQVTVEDEPGETADPVSQKKTIRIRGNGVTGALIFRDCDDNEIGRIDWQDGLIITGGDVIIPVTACGTPEVPP